MMYKILCDDRVLYDPLAPELKLISAELALECNTAGTLTFTISPCHPYYDNIHKRTSIVKVYQDDTLLFIGSPIDEEQADDTTKSITVEGALAYLNDTVQPYAEYHDMTVSGYLSTLLDIHNNQVSAFKQFTLGTVTVTDSNDSLYRYTNYEKTKDSISEDLIDSLGGYLRVRHENGINYLDYLESYDNVNSQGVTFGVNLISCIKSLKSSTTATAIIPLGAKLDDSEQRLTIADVNDGVIYVYDQESVDEFDWIYDTVTFDDVTTASALLTKGYSELAVRKYLSGTYTLNALDMSLLGGNYQSIRLGDTIPITSAKHGLDGFMEVTAQTVNLCDPTQSTLTIGDSYTTLTDANRAVTKTINTIVENYVTGESITEVKSLIETNASLIDQQAAEILMKVSQEYTSNDAFESYQSSVSSQTADQIEFSFTSLNASINSIEDVIGENQSLLEEYIRFNGALIELGRTDSTFTAEFDNESLRFLENGQVIAYISNNKLYIENAEITSTLTISNYQFQISPESGAVSLFYIGG